MNDIEKAIIHLKSNIKTYQNMLNGAHGELGSDGIKIIQDSIETCKTVIQVLEEKQQREQGCEYCKGEKIIGCTFEITEYIWGYEMKGYGEEGNTESCKIKYCPMCGRKAINNCEERKCHFWNRDKGYCTVSNYCIDTNKPDDSSCRYYPDVTLLEECKDE